MYPYTCIILKLECVVCLMLVSTLANTQRTVYDFFTGSGAQQECDSVCLYVLVESIATHNACCVVHVASWHATNNMVPCTMLLC